MDESLQLLAAVETLDLSRNKFTKADNLRKCVKLKHLDLGFNHLRTVSSFSEVQNFSCLIQFYHILFQLVRFHLEIIMRCMTLMFEHKLYTRI